MNNNFAAYLDRANECEQEALLAKNQHFRSELEDIARMWRKLASLRGTELTCLRRSLYWGSGRPVIGRERRDGVGR